MNSQNIEKLTIPCLTLSTGRTLKGFVFDPRETAPPGFIALENPDVAGYIEFVKVSNIVSFSVPKDKAPMLWYCFNPTPETINVRGH